MFRYLFNMPITIKQLRLYGMRRKRTIMEKTLRETEALTWYFYYRTTGMSAYMYSDFFLNIFSFSFIFTYLLLVLCIYNSIYIKYCKEHIIKIGCFILPLISLFFTPIHYIHIVIYSSLVLYMASEKFSYRFLFTLSVFSQQQT